MWVKTEDGTVKYVEVITLALTISYNNIVFLNEYEINIHMEKDKNIEKWLKGELRIFEDRKTFIETLLKENKQNTERQRGYIT